MRIVTRGDFDGLTSTILLSEVERIDKIKMAHPRDVQDGRVPADEQDIIVNLPYVLGCGMWFDHHSSEFEVAKQFEFKGRFDVAPSCARVIYDHYAKTHGKTLDRYHDLLHATDRFDSAKLSIKDVAQPAGYVLLGLTLDPRSGIIPDHLNYFEFLVKQLKSNRVDTLLGHPMLSVRTSEVLKKQAEFEALLRKHAHVSGNVIISDFRGVKGMAGGNRFLAFALFPEANVDVRIIDAADGEVEIAVGHSIFNRTCQTDIGGLMQEFGGGGHRSVGATRLSTGLAERQIAEILRRLNENDM